MPFTTATATITQGNSLSDSVDCTTGTLWRIGIPVQWITAPIVLLASSDNVTFSPLLDKVGDAIVLPTIENRWINLVGAWTFPSVSYLQIQSGLSDALITQDNADMLITVVLQTP